MVDSQQTVLDASKIKTDDEVDLIETAIERGAAAPTVRERAGHRVPPERPAARGGQPERPFGSSAVSRSRDRTRRRRRRRSVATRTAGRQCRDGPHGSRLAESAPRGVVPGMHRIGRRADSRAAVPAKIEQDESRPRPRLDTHPGPFRDFPQADLPIPPPREPVSDHRLDEGCDESGAA